MLVVKLVSCLDQVHRWARLGRASDVLPCSLCATPRASVLLLQVKLNAHVGLSSELPILVAAPCVQSTCVTHSGRVSLTTTYLDYLSVKIGHLNWQALS